MYKGYKLIGLCVTRIGNEDITDYVRAFNENAVKNGYRLIVYQSSSDMFWNTAAENGDKAVFDIIHYDILDGIVILADSFYDKSVTEHIVDKAEQYGIPVFWKGNYNTKCTNVQFNAEISLEKLITHLIKVHNVSDPCFIGGVRNESHSEKRIAIYKKVLKKNNIEFRGDRLYYGDFWSGPTEKALKQILQSEKLPDAIICANDVMALTVYNMLAEEGIRVPEDIIVTGYDGIVATSCEGSAITTCCEDYNMFAKAVFSALDDYLNGSELPEEIQVEMLVDLKYSCGCQPKRKLEKATKYILDYQNIINKYQSDSRLIYEVSENVFNCNNIKDLIHFFSLCKLDMCYLAFNGDTFKESVHPTEYNRENSFDDSMILVYDTSVSEEYLPSVFQIKQLIPNCDEIFKMENPIVFSSLSFQGKARGLMINYTPITGVCYRKIPQCVTMFNNAIGDYLLFNHLRYVQDNMKYMSEHDYLTNLYNRTGFFKYLKDIIIKSGSGKYISVVSLDLNNLKKINDNYGHDEGDFAIKSAGDSLRAIPYDNIIYGRFGGDEMVACFVSETKNVEKTVRDAIVKYLNGINEASGKAYRVEASIGICTMPSSKFVFEVALEESDKYMYEDKLKSKQNETESKK